MDVQLAVGAKYIYNVIAEAFLTHLLKNVDAYNISVLFLVLLFFALTI